MRQTGNKVLPTPQNPCVRNCCLDNNEICLGCGRELNEILRWHLIEEADRHAILERAASRLTRS